LYKSIAWELGLPTERSRAALDGQANAPGSPGIYMATLLKETPASKPTAVIGKQRERQAERDCSAS